MSNFKHCWIFITLVIGIRRITDDLDPSLITVLQDIALLMINIRVEF